MVQTIVLVAGISIIDHTISIVPSAVGKTYSAGPNIGIYDVSGQPTISSKDWSNEISDASANSYTQSTSYFNDWINGQYNGDITNITNNLTALSGDLSSYYKKTETSSKEQISDALQYVSANAGKVYEGVSPIVVNNVEDKISADTWTLSAGDGVSFTDDSANKVTRIDVTAQGGDEEVNSFVHNNSATILDVNSSYQANSGTFLTAIPSDVATKGDIDSLAQSVSDTYYPKSNPSSFATEEWVTSQGYLTAHQDISNKLDSSAFSSVSGDFLTTSFSIPESATWNDTSNVVQTNSAQWGQGGVTLTGDAQGAVDLVYSTSGNIITGTKSDYNFTAKNVTKLTLGNVTFDGVDKTILANQPEKPQESWFIGPWGYHLGPSFADGYNEQYSRVYLERTGLSSMSGSRTDKKLIWRALLDTDVEGANNTITAIAGSAIGGGVPQSAFDELKQSYDALSSLFATYSGQWLLPNEGV